MWAIRRHQLVCCAFCFAEGFVCCVVSRAYQQGEAVKAIAIGEEADLLALAGET